VPEGRGVSVLRPVTARYMSAAVCPERKLTSGPHLHGEQ
jgi:hypothetical protein